MSRVLPRLVRSERGGATIEMALILPTLIVMLWMIVQLGLVFRAMSGIQHGLGEGARLATVYPKPTNTAIRDKIEATVYGIGPGNFNIPTPVSGTSDGSGYVDLQVTYTQGTDLLVLPGPTISVVRSKRVWVAS